MANTRYVRVAAAARYVCDVAFLVWSARPQYTTYGYVGVPNVGVYVEIGQ